MARAGRRHVEPYRLVNASRRWYLMAFDLERDDWRTFRLDRITAPVASGARAQVRDAPDAAAFVNAGLAVGAYPTSALVRVHAPPRETAAMIGPAVGIIETTDPAATTTLVRIGGDDDWIARYIIGLEIRVDVDRLGVAAGRTRPVRPPPGRSVRRTRAPDAT